jgi:alpha-tubulin suppressor-like RCC1 family protein
VVWLVLGLLVSMGSACGGDQDASPPDCINGEDCAWIDIEHNESGTLGCAVRKEGTLWCWGHFNQTHYPGQSVWLPGFAQVHISAEIVDVSIGKDTICALDRSGAVWCWGDNHLGLVGDGTRDFRETPVPVGNLGRAIQITVGNAQSCVLLEDQSVWCWGPAEQDGSQLYVTEPTKKYGLENVMHLSFGRAHGCAIQTGGRILCWGSNDRGQVGLDGEVEYLSPFEPPYELPQPVKAMDVHCGNSHTCAVQDNGTVWCWGANYSLQLGLPVSTDGTHIPGQVATLVDIERVYAGNFNTCASNHDGDLFCWGDNSYGQIGRSPYEQVWYDIPVRYDHLSNIRSLSIQGAHWVYAVTEDGTAWGWGRYENLFVPSLPPDQRMYEFTWFPVRMYNPVRD